MHFLCLEPRETDKSVLKFHFLLLGALHLTLLSNLILCHCVLMKDSLVKKSGKVSVMMKNLKKAGSRRAEDARKYEAEKSRVVVTWAGVAMYLRASCAPLVAVLFLCHMLRTCVMVTADFWLAAWSVATLEDAASKNTTVCESVLLLHTQHSC